MTDFYTIYEFSRVVFLFPDAAGSRRSTTDVEWQGFIISIGRVPVAFCLEQSVLAVLRSDLGTMVPGICPISGR